MITGLSIAGIAIWGARQFLRNALVERHLYHDAQERAVMIQSFLALRETDTIPQDQIDPVLTTLYRPSSTGLLEPDTGPILASDALGKSKMPKSSK